MQNRLLFVNASPKNISPDIAINKSSPNLASQRVDDDRLAIVRKRH